MLIRTLRPCEIAGRNVPAGLPLDLPEDQAQALVEAGAAEPYAPPTRADLAPKAAPEPEPAPAKPARPASKE